MAWLLVGVATGCAAGSHSSLAGTDEGSGSSVGGSGSATGVGGSNTGTGGAGGTGVASASSSSSGGQGGMDPCAMGCAKGFTNLDQNPLTGTCGCEYACDKKGDTDPIDPDFKDENCDGTDGVAEKCVYVSKSLGKPDGTGTRQSPVDTIAQGISVAKKNSVPAVCVSGSAGSDTYAEAVAVESGISVYGGFDAADPEFAFRRSAKAITTVTAAGAVFTAVQIDSETHIEGLTIKATTPKMTGMSTYGVQLAGGNGQLFAARDGPGNIFVAPGRGFDRPLGDVDAGEVCAGQRALQAA